MNYLLVDGLNMFMRAKHVGGKGSIDMKIGMAMHIMFNSINKCWREFDGNHIVLCLEGRSWRKDFYTPYKANRRVVMDSRSVREQEDDELYFEAYDDMVKFFAEKTNVSVVRCEQAEADDMIATWIQQHPDDNHYIISTDSDFYQLLAPNVTQYNGTTDQVVTLEGWKDLKTGEDVIDKKTQAPKKAIDPQFALFEKCVRGDSSDNVFSAYPGARMKGTKNKTGIMEAFEDRNTGGYNYNNFMLQRWIDHEETEHRVRDDFERNKILIDLTEQPDEIKELCNVRMNEGKQKEPVANIGIHFMKFCAKWDLQRMSDQAQNYSGMLNGRAG
jgi:5'-3' exonuclease|tara:strand:+ start:60 stop:1046 length:987 start_codon:yes stop_codon:yes gene_type:complete